MFFEIIPASTGEYRLAPGVAQTGKAEPVIRRRWVYREGSPEKPGAAVCQSPADFDSEESCRSNIAVAKRKFGASKFAKVVNQ